MHNRSKWKRATWKGLNNAFLVLVFQVDGPTTGGACMGVGVLASGILCYPDENKDRNAVWSLLSVLHEVLILLNYFR